jgi:hypothetical protein
MNQRTRIRRGAAALAVLVMLALVITPVLAQTYRFSVPKAAVDVYVNEDGTVSLDYDYQFKNDASADPLDAVDIGMPTSNYDLGSVTGTVNGKTVTSIEQSPYVKPGIALNLGANQIMPGQSGEVTAHVGTVKGMLFKAKTQEQEPYASFQFQPNYFGSEFVTGSTNLTVRLHLPPGLKETEPRYFTPKSWPGSDAPTTSYYDDQNRVTYEWNAPNASSSAAYTFGAAFPARLVPASALLTETPFNFGNLTDALCPWLFCFGIVGFIGLTIYASVVGDRKRRLSYLPPKVSVEGNGIKRGLTAIEAAILMEQPMDKILQMILFSVVKKGAAKVVSQNPMKLDIAPTLPEGLQTYETAFLTAMQFERSAEQRRGLQTMMTELVKSVGEKMRGFSRKETIAYYKDIMEKAWAQVDQANTPEMKMEAFDANLDWTMLDRNFQDHTQTSFGHGPVFVPMWWGNYDPSFGHHMSSAGASVVQPSGLPVSTGANRPPTGVSLPNLPGGAFAASVVTGMQNFSSNVVGNLTSFTGGVTDKTNPVPKTTYTGGGSRGGGGGRSCACACACAGCACACAGGGR